MGEGPEVAAPLRATGSPSGPPRSRGHRGRRASSPARSCLWRKPDMDGGGTRTRTLWDVPGEQAAGGHCAPPRPSATGGTAAQRRLPVKDGRGSVSPRRSVDGGGRALTLSHRFRAIKRRPGSSVSGCRLSVSGWAGREASLSLAEPNRAGQRRGLGIQCRRICGLGGQRRCWPPAPHWGGQTGGTRPNLAVYAPERHGLAETEPRRGLAARRHLPGRDGWSPIPG